MILKLAVPTGLMIAVLTAINHLIAFDISNIWGSIAMIVLNAAVGGTIYVGVCFKMGLIDQVFGREYVKKIIKKLTFGKVSLKG